MTTEDFINTSLKKAQSENSALFFAPGRVNLIGEHTDYTGGLVLPAAIQYGTYLLITKHSGDTFIFSSENFPEKAEIPLPESGKKQNAWFDYPLGVITELKNKGWQPEGLRFHYYGDIPTGAGLSSSASIEVVTAYAINRLYDLGISGRELALLSQRAENNFVGVQCGIMDQYAVALGQSNHALQIDCHDITHEPIPVKFKDYEWMVINSNKKRGLVDSEYNKRVQELEEARKQLNNSFDVPYLGMLQPEDADWIDKLVTGETALKRLRHVVNENRRVRLAAEFLKAGDAKQFGQMMILSHDSLAHDFEVSCKELDTLVTIAMDTPGVAGSRMTGAGFGGCTLTLVHRDAVEDLKNRVATLYEKETGLKPGFYPVTLTGEPKKY